MPLQNLVQKTSYLQVRFVLKIFFFPLFSKVDILE
jgi:hypothetical protein